MCYLVSRIDSQGRHAGSVSAIKGTGGIVDRLPPPIATTPSAVASFIGCYRDTSDFDLKGYLERSTQNTPQRCVQICAGKGFAYAGVQYGESCLCGNSYGRYGQANNCNMACTGDRQQSCGGFNANSVYTTGIVALAPTPATTPAPPPAPPALSDKTCWDWYGEFLDGRTFTGHTVTFQVDGNKVAGTWGWTGTWRTDGKRNFWVYWSTRPDPNQADMLTLSADGRTLEGRNFETRRIRGTLRSCS